MTFKGTFQCKPLCGSMNMQDDPQYFLDPKVQAAFYAWLFFFFFFPHSTSKSLVLLSFSTERLNTFRPEVLHIMSTQTALLFFFPRIPITLSLPRKNSMASDVISLLCLCESTAITLSWTLRFH